MGMGKLRSQSRNRGKVWPRKWKFEDDYSGATFYSNKAVMDDNGFMTVRRFKDKPDPRRHLYTQGRFTEDRPEWTRPRQVNVFVDPDTSNGAELIGQ